MADRRTPAKKTAGGGLPKRERAREVDDSKMTSCIGCGAVLEDREE